MLYYPVAKLVPSSSIFSNIIYTCMHVLRVGLQIKWENKANDISRIKFVSCPTPNVIIAWSPEPENEEKLALSNACMIKMWHI